MNKQKIRALAFILLAIFALSALARDGFVASLVSGEIVESFERDCTIKTEMSASEAIEALSVNVIREENVSGVVIYYGYSPYGNKTLEDEMGRFNCQIAESERGTTIGFPLIRGGY